MSGSSQEQNTSEANEEGASSSTTECINNFLKDWGIKKKVFTITLDNAVYNNGVVECLKDHLRLNDALVCDGEYLHVRCGAHILNLIVQSGLKVIEGAIEKVRESVKFVRGSFGRKRKFAECIAQQSLKCEATNSWDHVISGMAKEMKTKFEKYWDTYSMILSFAVILDPHYKMKIIEYCFDKLGMAGEMLSDKVGSIESGLRNLYNGYKSKVRADAMHDLNLETSQNVAALVFGKGAVSRVARGPNFSLFDACFDLLGQTEVKIPTVVMHFTGANVSLLASNYLIPVASNGEFCFVFAGNTSGLSIIDNIQQQGFRVVYDLAVGSKRQKSNVVDDGSLYEESG
nr:zinc finger BED domain-containing protein RICESLEEPER 2-like [Tanacetum cinerariifolium]